MEKGIATMTMPILFPSTTQQRKSTSPDGLHILLLTNEKLVRFAT